MSIKFQQMAFIQSASTVLQCPRDGGTEIALIGRSNAGKSSALNIIANQKNLAKTSKQPGYTRLINLFSVDENRRLVDLPGYGYAKVSQALKADMERVINEYIHERRCLYGVLVLMDIRHPLQEGDIACIETLLEAHKKVHVILTKSDKLTKNQAQATLALVKKELEPHKEWISVQNLSAHSGEGVDEVRNLIETWFESKTK